MRQEIQLDALVDPFEARLDIYCDDTGALRQVAFDLSGLPRIDAMLVGKHATEVPDITKRLCGLCPVVHHLAGVRAVESLFGISDIPRTAQLIRRLLCAGSILDSLATKYVSTDRNVARSLKAAGKALMQAAGSPGHFPEVAVPGGVQAPVDSARVAAALAALAPLQEWAAEPAAEPAEAPADNFDGLDVAVVNSQGELDPLGEILAVVDRRAGTKEFYPASEYRSRVTETHPGATAPRPTFTTTGPGQPGRYFRVGPMSRRLVKQRPQSSLQPSPQSSPQVAQRELLRDTIVQAGLLLADPELLGEHVANAAASATIAEADFPGQRVGVGVVDGPRGVLAHCYQAGSDGIITDCLIMTPTAHNEYWLTTMLTEQLRNHPGALATAGASAASAASNAGAGEGSGIEKSIWAADPCLPCSSAPAGLMSFQVQERGIAPDRKGATI